MPAINMTGVTGGKPFLQYLVFPEHTIDRVKQLYEEFHDQHYDMQQKLNCYNEKLCSYPGTEPLSDEGKLLLKESMDVSMRTHTANPEYHEVLPCDVYAPKEYLSAVYYCGSYGRDESVLEEMLDQFYSFLWNKEVPVAMHLRRDYDTQTYRNLSEIGFRTMD